MSFKIDVKGLDDVQRKIKDLQNSLEPTAFNEWANRVVVTAGQLCNDPDLKRIKLRTIGQQFSYDNG